MLFLKQSKNALKTRILSQFFSTINGVIKAKSFFAFFFDETICSNAF